MVANALLDVMKKFLDGHTPPLDFSFDFPLLLREVDRQLLEENPELSDLLNDDLPEVCAWFEPNPSARTVDCLDEESFRKKVNAVYKKAQKLTKTA